VGRPDEASAIASTKLTSASPSARRADPDEHVFMIFSLAQTGGAPNPLPVYDGIGPQRAD
jgi:hypothetical protein